MKLLIDIPHNFNNPYALIEKVFEYIDSDRPIGEQYLAYYTIVYRSDRDKNGCIQKLIDDWSLHSIPVTPGNNSNKSKMDAIYKMQDLSDEALLFLDNNTEDKESEITHNVLLDVNSHVYTKVVRVDKNLKIWEHRLSK